MSGISTHILDTVLGRPAPGVTVRLERLQQHTWQPAAQAITDADGRARPLLPAAEVHPGRYRLTFDVQPYFAARNLATLYPEIVVAFNVAPGETSLHLPLLLTPNSYTTYRGS